MGRRRRPTSPLPESPEDRPAHPPYSGVRKHRRGERLPTSSERDVQGQTRLDLGDLQDQVPAAGEDVGRILLGPHAVAEALRSGRRPVQVVYVASAERRERLRALATLARDRGVPVRTAETDLLETLAAGRACQGVAALAGEYPYLDLAGLAEVISQRGREALVVALDQIQDPQNLGAIVRSCVAFGADAVVIPARRAAGVTDAVVRASAGATELLAIARVPNLAEVLRRLSAAGLDVVGIDPEGEVALDAADLRPPMVLVLGAEGHGLRRLTRELCNRRVRIPIAAGGVGSLNVSVAAGIALNTVVRRRP